MSFDYFVCLDSSTSEGFAIFSLHRSKSSIVFPVLGVNAIPVRAEETVSTSFPLDKALFTIFMMKSGCMDRRAESSGGLTKTLFVLERLDRPLREVCGCHASQQFCVPR